MRISEIISQRGPGVVTIASTAPVSELLELLGQHNIGCVVVSDSDGRVDGIVSERDIVRHLAQHEVSGKLVRTVMVTNVVTCRPDDDLGEMARRMTEDRIRHVPVVDDMDQLVGIVSIGDIVKNRLDQLQADHDHLVNYMHS